VIAFGQPDTPSHTAVGDHSAKGPLKPLGAVDEPTISSIGGL
jgi:hypothetical protein